MNEFDNLEHLNNTFQSGQFVLPKNMTVGGFPYHYSQSAAHTIPEMKNENKKLFVIYAIDPSFKETETWKETPKVEDRELQEWIIFIWALDRTLTVHPARVATTSAARGITDLNTASHNLREGNDTIPDTVPVRFIQFNKMVPGKVDTGANLSSLHCEEWRVDSGKNIVEFQSSILSNNTIRTTLLDQAVIKTSEGSEYRPIIALNIIINNKHLQNCKFNLNDRSSMSDKILIGQNILEQGKFLVDPNKQQNSFESVDWDTLQEMYKDVTVKEEQSNGVYRTALQAALDVLKETESDEK